MDLIDRLILGIYTFCLAIISFFIFLVGAGAIPYQITMNYITLVLTNVQYISAIIIISALFFLASLKFLLSGLTTQKEKAAIRKNSQLGNVLISLNSIQNIISSTVKQIDGVMDVKIGVKNNKESVKAKLHVTVTPEYSIPNLSNVIQTRVKEVIEKIAGIEVSTIEVFVDDVVQTLKPKTKTPVE